MYAPENCLSFRPQALDVVTDKYSIYSPRNDPWSLLLYYCITHLLYYCMHCTSLDLYYRQFIYNCIPLESVLLNYLIYILQYFSLVVVSLYYSIKVLLYYSIVCITSSLYYSSNAVTLRICFPTISIKHKIIEFG